MTALPMAVLLVLTPHVTIAQGDVKPFVTKGFFRETEGILFRMRYPRFQAVTPLTRLANRVILRWVRRERAEYMTTTHRPKRSKGSQELEQEGLSGSRWTYEADYEVTYYHPDRLISMRFESCAETGGHHGNCWITVFNFGRVGGKVRVLVFEDFFKEGSPYEQFIRDAVVRKLGEEGAPWPENVKQKHLRRFIVTSDGLEFLFNAYEVGSYAEGSHYAKLTFDELGPAFNRMLVLE